MTDGDSTGERERGILSTADRDFLRSDPDDYSRQARHAREEAIRERVTNAVLDFTLLFQHLKHDQREEIFGGSLTTQRRFDDPDFEAGVRDTLAFMIEGSGGFARLDEWEYRNEITAERMLKEAFTRGAWRWGYDLQDLRLEVVAEEIPVRELLQRLDAGDELTVDELARLAVSQRDRVDPAVLQEPLREQLLDGDRDD